MVGETIGNDVLERKLGAGGMGEVYLGKLRRIGRPAAIKLLLPQFSADPEVLDDLCRTRGGSFKHGEPLLRCDARPQDLARSSVASDVGFRCCG